MLMRLDTKNVNQYHRDGFLMFDTGLPAAEVATLRGILTGLHSRNIGFEEGAAFDAMGVDDGSTPRKFPQIIHPRAFAPELLDTSFFRQASAIAEQILGPNVRFKADLSLMKPAGIGGATPWHQDEAFEDPDFTYNELSFWLALQPVDESNSCMAYIPGSHHAPVLPHGFPGDDPRIHALECISGFDPRDAVQCPLPAGGCVIHNQRTVHGAGPNFSGRERLAYVLIFNTVPVPAPGRRSFPWRARHKTARAQRELAWRRHGGFLVHLWRQRSRVRVSSLRALVFDLGRAGRAVWRMCLAHRV